MRVALLAPKWDRTCESCQKWRHDDNGYIIRQWDGSPAPQGKAPTPCMSCAKVPTWAKRDGTRDADELRALAYDMTPENRKAFERFREYKATGRFPDDPLVTWYAGLINPIYEEWEQTPHKESVAATLQLIQTIQLMLAVRRY